MKTKHKFSVEGGKIIYHDMQRLLTEMKKYTEAWLVVSDEKSIDLKNVICPQCGKSFKEGL